MAVHILGFMPKDLADVLRAAIRDSGLSALKLSGLTGVPQQRISDFLRGRDIRMSTANKLAAYLRLEFSRKK